MYFTANPLSVVPATTFTGELTLALFAGLQMVTDGEVVLSVQLAKAGTETRNRTAAATNFRVCM
jgi:hypothetical protein